MKKITLLLPLSFLLALAAVNFSSAQTHVLFGTCAQGGASNGGTIFQADLDGSNLHAVHSFVMAEGLWPWGKTAQAPNGKVYGVTFLGGCSDSCTIYEYDPIAGTCTDVYDFYCSGPISEPSQAGLIILPDGNLYGLQQSGFIYRFNPNTHVYTLLHQTTSGAFYTGGLMQASDGALYGVAYQGTANANGFIFRYDLSLNTYTVLHTFDGPHGANPDYENLIQATDGKLYGTTFQGGANGLGVIFSYDLSSNIYTDLYDFNGPQGGALYNGLIQASNGKLYGVTYQGGSSSDGVIFSYDIPTSQYLMLYEFDGSNGSGPIGGLTQASNGKLFGTTHAGGISNGGVAFSYDIAANAYTVLANFNSGTGTYPQCDIQEAIIEPTGIASATNSSTSIYIDQANQLVVNSSEFGGKGEIMVYDGLGKNVFQSKIVNQKSEFDLSSFRRGIYFVQLNTGKEIVTQKIILSK